MKKEVKIGITAIIAVLIVYFGIIFLKGIKLAHTDNVYYVRMNNVNGLLVAGDVICNGLKIGMVKNMNYFAEAQEIVVAVELDEGFAITRGSTAQIAKDMLGAPKLQINLGTDPKALLAVGDTIRGLAAGGDVLAAAGAMIPDIQAVLPKVDSLITALNDLARDPALKASLQNVEALTAELQTTSQNLTSMTTALNEKMPGMLAKADNIIGSLETTTDGISQVDIPGIAAKANTTLDNVETLTGNLNTLTYDLTAKLSSTDNTLGRFLNDASVYDHLDSTMQNASLLMQDLREHPTRYVHFSLFGKKEK